MSKVVPFGKYKGLTLGSIYEQDKSYLEWMAYRSDPTKTEPIWRSRAAEICENPPVANFTEMDGTDSDLPF